LISFSESGGFAEYLRTDCVCQRPLHSWVFGFLASPRRKERNTETGLVAPRSGIVYLVGGDFVVGRDHLQHAELDILDGALGRVAAHSELLRIVMFNDLWGETMANQYDRALILPLTTNWNNIEGLPD